MMSLDIKLPTSPESGTQLPAEQHHFDSLQPHRPISLDGVLCSGQTAPRRHNKIAHIALNSLIGLVRQVTNWVDGEQRLGDYRFLVLDFKTASGIEAFVQIWSEPFCNLTVGRHRQSRGYSTAGLRRSGSERASRSWL